ncbi:MAG: hypothetical protein C5B56_04905 [Proteobacteria bacterium]|nr:MAG: hypothetical protein C5B56_04905 [Pseudomonadota bacterium]
MRIKPTLISAAIIISSAVILGSAPAQAQDRATSEGKRLHQLCEGGDKRACVRFGMMMNENRARHDEWRKSNPEFWSYQSGGDKRAASGSGSSPTSQPWCGVPYGSVRECVYQTIGQCEASVRPLGGDCEPRD